MIVPKSPGEIDRMREAGRVVAEAHRLAASMIEPGRPLRDIDAAITRLYDEHGADAVLRESSSRGRFPAASCLSVNEQVAHAIPGDRRLEEGDIVSVDTACRLDGWCSDAAWTYPVGPISPLKQSLLHAGCALLSVAIKGLATCQLWSEVAKLVSEVANQTGFSLVGEFAGHGIGREIHEDPRLAIAREGNPEIQLAQGLVLAIEPVLNAGKPQLRPNPDGWTLETLDGLPSVHFEHTVALGEAGPEVLTEGVGWLQDV